MDGDQQLIKGRREKDVKLNDFIMRINDVVLNEFLNKRGRYAAILCFACRVVVVVLFRPKQEKKSRLNVQN